MDPLRAGAVIGQRFVVEALVGEGGMGRVYRARDEHTGQPVAVKLPLGGASPGAPSPEQAARFARESRLLARLRHPAIVTFVDSGSTDDGQPFLAMEWLEGLDLAERVATAPLSAAESLIVARRVAGALLEAQRHGVVHRDLKPSNIFLRGGAPQRATLLDFGVARRVAGVSAIGQTQWATSATSGTAVRTATGALLGTPHYMAPEQARGERDVGPAADVFALGCVLYECLAGQPPFAGQHIAAVLAQLLFDEPPPLARLRPDVPEDLRGLIASMLAKSPAARPSAADVIDLLDQLGPFDGSQRPRVIDRPAGLGRDEQQIATVILAAAPATQDDDATVAAEQLDRLRPAIDSLAAALRPLGARPELLADQSVVVTFPERSASAADQAKLATRCAIALRERWPDANVAIATGRSPIRGGRATGEALSRAGRLLATVALAPDDVTPGRILLEDVTAGLLGARASLTRVGEGVSVLVGDTLTELDGARRFLGRPTPCVGREVELGTLQLALSGCVEDETSRALVIVAPPGVGKSRLRDEFCRRVSARGDELVVVTARAEPLRASLPLELIRGALRELCGVVEDDDREAQRAAIRRRVARHPALRDPAAAAAEFLGELCGVPFPDEACLKLQAARQDPRVMNDQLRGAFIELARAECELSPVVLLLEDLHWSDRPSVELLHEALLALADAPLLLVAFARPEVHEVFPGLWKGKAQELPLRPLSKKACARFVRRVAAGALDPAVIERIVERAAGNALYLEELTRAAIEGDDEQAPETVLAMLQARLGRLEAGDRRVLRAGSIFGQVFSEDGVHALLGADTSPEELRHSLRAVIDQELVEAPRGETSGRVFRFRHALMREAAYARSTDDDRRVGHRLAAGFLSAAGEAPGVVAEHYAESDAPTEAIPYFVRAAEHALDRFDIPGTRHYTQRGRALAPAGALAGVLLSLEALGCTWFWQWKDALRLCTEALPLVGAGSKAWCHAIHVQCYAACYIDPDRARARALADRYLAMTPEPDAAVAYSDFASHMASALIQTGAPARGLALLRRARDIAGDAMARRPLLKAWHNLASCSYYRYTDDDIPRQIELAREAMSLYERAGATKAMYVLAQDLLGEVLARAGAIDEALTLLRRSMVMADALPSLVTYHARLALANTLVSRGAAGVEEVDEAESLVRAILEHPNVTRGYKAMSLYVRARAHISRGALDEAAADLAQAIELSEHAPTRRMQMTATQIRLLLRARDPDAASTVARDALAELATLGPSGFGELPLLAASAEALLASGAEDEGLSALRRAHERLIRIASGFEDEGTRARFLAEVPLHARVIALAAARLDRPAPVQRAHSADP